MRRIVRRIGIPREQHLQTAARAADETMFEPDSICNICKYRRRIEHMSDATFGRHVYCERADISFRYGTGAVTCGRTEIENDDPAVHPPIEESSVQEALRLLGTPSICHDCANRRSLYVTSMVNADGNGEDHVRCLAAIFDGSIALSGQRVISCGEYTRDDDNAGEAEVPF